MPDDDQNQGQPEPLTADNLASAFDKLADRLANVVAAKPAAELAAPAAPEKEYTRAELAALVAEDKISQDQADAQIEKQIEKRVTARVTETVATGNLVKTLDEQIAGFTAKVPALNDKASPEFARVAAAFKDLTANGSPNTKATELAALKIAFPEQTMRDRGRDTTTNPEGGSGGGPAPRGRPRSGEREDEPPSALNARQRQHYERLISTGIYQDWKQVREELKHAKPTRAA